MMEHIELVRAVLSALGIEMTDEEIVALGEDGVIELAKKKIAEAKERAADDGDAARDAVQAALMRGEIRSDEVEWALGVASADVRTFRRAAAELCERRGVLTPRFAGIRQVMARESLQDRINRQVGVSEELFRRYNPAK